MKHKNKDENVNENKEPLVGLQSVISTPHDLPIINPPVVLKKGIDEFIFPPLSEDMIHKIDELTYLAHGTNSVVYIFGQDIAVKYAVWKTEKAKNLSREAIIGLELNKLNNPNFMRTIGYYIDNKCQIKDLSEKERKQGCIYLYLQKVAGPNLGIWIQTGSSIQFKNLFLKLLRSYEEALRKLDFTHYDLNTDNVIISAVGDTIQPVIIDFGMSHIKLANVDVGIMGF